MALPTFRLSAIYFAYFAFIGAYMPYFGLYLAEIGQSAWAIGVLISLGQFMRIFAPNLWAWLADRRGRSIGLLRAAMVLAVLSFCALFYVRSFAGLVVVLAVHAFFVSASMPLFEAMTLSYLRGAYGRYGGIRLWGSIGFIVAVCIVGWGLDRLGTMHLLWMALVPLAAGALAAFIIEQPPAAEHAHETSVRARLFKPEVLALLGAGFLMCVAHGPLYAFYSIYLDQSGYSKTAVGALWSLGVIAEIVVFFAMPHWLHRISAYRILLFSFALAALRFALIGWGVESLSLLIFAQLLHAASFGSYHAAALAVFNAWFAGKGHVRGQALFSSMTYGAGGAVGALAAGALWETAGPAWTFTAAAVAAACGLLLVMWRGHAFPRVEASRPV